MSSIMENSTLFGLAMLAYILASALYSGSLIFKAGKLDLAARILAWAGVGLHVAATLWRWQESRLAGAGHAPLSNMYESLVFFALCIALTQLFLEHRHKIRLGAFVMPLAALAMAYASFSPYIDGRIKPLIPALQSNWLIGHVVSCFIGYGAFAVAAALAFMYLARNPDERAAGVPQQEDQTCLAQQEQMAKPDFALSRDALTELIHNMMLFGFLWLSAGIASGAVWANVAWGSYWSWDPKETWSIITWFFYAVTLHGRLTQGWSGGRIAWLALAGFAVVLFTFLGVNYFLPGLHSYGAA